MMQTDRSTTIMSVNVDFIYQDGSIHGKRTSIALQKDADDVKINYRISPLPYSKFGVEVQKVGSGISILGNGIHIKWLNHARLFLILGPEYAGKVDGECGWYCTPPPGRVYPTWHSRTQAKLRLAEPYNDNIQLEMSIINVLGPDVAEVKITGTDSGHTIIFANLTLTEDLTKPTKQMQKEIETKLKEGKDKEGHTLTEILHDKVVEVKVSEPEVEFNPNDFPVEPEIEARDAEEDAD